MSKQRFVATVCVWRPVLTRPFFDGEAARWGLRNTLPGDEDRRDAPPLHLWAHWRDWEGMSSGLWQRCAFGGPF